MGSPAGGAWEGLGQAGEGPFPAWEGGDLSEPVTLSPESSSVGDSQQGWGRAAPGEEDQLSSAQTVNALGLEPPEREIKLQIRSQDMLDW